MNLKLIVAIWIIAAAKPSAASCEVGLDVRPRRHKLMPQRARCDGLQRPRMYAASARRFRPTSHGTRFCRSTLVPFATTDRLVSLDYRIECAATPARPAR